MTQHPRIKLENLATAFRDAIAKLSFPHPSAITMFDQTMECRVLDQELFSTIERIIKESQRIHPQPKCNICIAVFSAPSALQMLARVSTEYPKVNK